MRIRSSPVTSRQNVRDRSVSWLGSVSEELEESGPTAFTLRRLQRQDNLFAHRSALFYTPTRRIPREYVGNGELDVTLPIATPDYPDLLEIRALGSPRLWVELLQRHTGKLRWTAMRPATIIFTRYDYFSIRSDHLAIGRKGLLDALKVGTSGRRDGIYLYYFGAIIDDAPGVIDAVYGQELVQHPHQLAIRVRVTAESAADPESGVS